MRRRWFLLIWAAIIGVLLLMRLAPWGRTFLDEGVRFTANDPYYHIRRVMLCVGQFPRVPVYDSYMWYPEGMACPWLPLFDVIVAGCALVVGAGSPAKELVERVAALAPVGFGVVAAIAVYAATRRAFGVVVGLVSAFFLAVLAEHITTTAVGRLDHHCAEGLAVALLVWALAALLDASGRSEGRSTPRWWLAVGATGAALAFGMLIWQGFFVFVGVACLFVVIVLVMPDAGRSGPQLSAGMAIACTLGAALVFPTYAGIARVSGGAAGFVGPSSLYPLLLVAAGAGMVVLHLVALAADRFRLAAMTRGLLLLLVIALAVLVFRLLFPDRFASAAAGVRYVLMPGDRLSWVSESQGAIVSLGRREDTRALVRVLPVCLSAIVLMAIASRRRPAGILVTLFAAASWVLVLISVRFLYPFAAMEAILLGFLSVAAVRRLWAEGAAPRYAVRISAIVLLVIALALLVPGLGALLWPIGAGLVATAVNGVDLMGAHPFGPILLILGGLTAAFGLWRLPAKRRTPWSYLVFTIVSATALAVMLPPPHLLARETGRVLAGVTGFRGVSVPMYRALTWLRANSPPTRHYDDPRETPEYGVISPWDYGHWIIYLAERPAVSNGFGLLTMRGQAEGNRFLMARSEQEAEEVAARTRSRYVVLGNMVPYLGSIARSMGGSTRDFYDIEKLRSGHRRYALHRPFFEMFYTRLHLCDGSQTDLEGLEKMSRLRVRGVSHYRLAYESPDLIKSMVSVRGEPVELNWIKIFERVPGATITGSAPPGEGVLVSLPIVTNTGRFFQYEISTAADVAGRFRITVPYATEPRLTEGTRAAGAYAVMAAGDEASVEVPEEAILKGLSVSIPSE